MDNNNENKLNKEESIRFAKKYVEDLISFFGLNTDIYASADGEVIELSIPSTYLNSFLIGREGSTLKSLQFIISQVLRQQNAELVRVNIDIANYKSNANKKLAAKAEDWVKEVLESGQSKDLPPMNAAERRIIHKALQDYPEISTDSEGEGRDRHIIIKKK